MFFLGLIYALAIGMLIAWVWSRVFNTHGPWNNFFLFFLVIFLFSWGAGSWIVPFGPMGWGVSWMAYLCMGIFMALLLTAVTPREKRHQVRYWGWPARPQGIQRPVVAGRGIGASIDIFFWMLIGVMAALIIENYVLQLRPF